MNKLTRYKRTRITRTHKVIISFILLVFTIGLGYSALVTNLSISGNITIKEYDDTIHWVRLVDKQGREDRFYVKADYIAFRAMKKVIFVKWKKLVEFVLEMVKGKEVVTKNPRKCYIPYNRDRDIAVMVLNDDLEKLSDFILNCV